MRSRPGRAGQRSPSAPAAPRAPERVRLGAEPQVVGAEVLTPLADEVRLVHDEQPRLGARAGQRPTSALDSSSGDTNTKPSGAAAAASAAVHARLERLEFRIVVGSPAASRCALLIVLEGDQGRDDHGRAAREQAARARRSRTCRPRSAARRARRARPVSIRSLCNWPGRRRENPNRSLASARISPAPATLPLPPFTVSPRAARGPAQPGVLPSRAGRWGGRGSRSASSFAAVVTAKTITSAMSSAVIASCSHELLRGLAWCPRR